MYEAFYVKSIQSLNHIILKLNGHENPPHIVSDFSFFSMSFSSQDFIH